MNFNDESDNKLDQFLKQNDPTPPEAQPHEKENILSTIENEQISNARNPWYIPITAVAASFLVGLLSFSFLMTPQDNSANLESFLNDSIEIAFIEEDFVGAGDDWLSLIENGIEP
jgi:hypothetical protein